MLYKTKEVSGAAEFEAYTADPQNGVPIDGYPWGGDYRPKARAWVAPDYKNGCLRVSLMAEEPSENLRGVCFTRNSRVWEDSCLEFFFNPAPDAEPMYYTNFECNINGALLTGLHTGTDEKRAREPADYFGITADRVFLPDDAVRWRVVYIIPFDWIKTYFPSFSPRPGMVIKGNFQICADLCAKPHFGCWNPIVEENPTFHRPECFGDIEL